MAMQGFEREAFSAPMAEINTTPLVDVMLVLLVIFLVTAPMLTQAIKLELPNETASEVVDQNPLTLSVSNTGDYYWGEEKVDVKTLEMRFQAAAMQNNKQPIHLRADANASYGKVSKILALVQKYGFSNIGFITEPK